MGLRTSPKASRQTASLAPNSSRWTAFFVSSEPLPKRLPKRLPLMSNSAFLSALVLGLAIFGDMDQNHAPTSQSRRCPDVTSPVLGPRFPDEQPPRSRGLLQTLHADSFNTDIAPSACNPCSEDTYARYLRQLSPTCTPHFQCDIPFSNLPGEEYIGDCDDMGWPLASVDY